MPQNWQFNPSYQHAKCWKYYKVRPPKGSSSPEKTNQQYCFYNSNYNSYEYTEEWVKLLINELPKEEIYKKIMKAK
jgi:hypothetical protein